MLQNRSLLPKVEVLSLRGDKTSIWCVKLLQSVQNFYHHKITKKWGVFPPPLKTSACNFCQPREVKGGGGKFVKRGRQEWPVSVRGQNFSSNFWKACFVIEEMPHHFHWFVFFLRNVFLHRYLCLRIQILFATFVLVIVHWVIASIVSLAVVTS